MLEKVTRSDLEKALTETAWSFYNKGPKVQYCGRPLNEKFLKWYGGAHRPPLYSKVEEATSHMDLHTVCSDYCYSVYDNALHYPLLGGRMNYTTHFGWLFTGYPVDFTTIRWVSKAYNNGTRTYNEEDLAYHLSMPISTLEETLDYMADYEKNLRPGDILCFYMKAGGHNMMYIGNGYILDSCGKSYDMSAGMDKREVNGSICRLRTVEDTFLAQPCTWDLRLYDKNDTPATFCVLRPLDLLVDENDELKRDYVFEESDGFHLNPNIQLSGYDITGATRTRMKYPGIEIDKIVNRTPYGTTFTGDVLTYSVTIQNCSNGADYRKWKSAYTGMEYHGEDYKGILVKEKIPYGTEFVSSSEGATVEDGEVRWMIDVPKGTSVTCRVSVRVIAKQGETIVSQDGMVDTTMTPTISNYVGGKKLDEEKRKMLSSFAKAGTAVWNSNEGFKISAKATGTQFACRVYNEAMHMDLQLPAVQELFDTLFSRKELNLAHGYGPMSHTPLQTWIYAQNTQKSPVRDMLIAGYVGGQYVYTDKINGEPRINEFRCEYLEPGDVIVHGKLSPYSDAGEKRTVTETNVMVYLGEGKIAALNTENEMFCIEGPSVLWKAFTFDFFVGLRPSQAYRDINIEIPVYDVSTSGLLTEEDANKALDPWSAEGLKKGFSKITPDSWALARYPITHKTLGLWTYSVAGLDLSEYLTQTPLLVLGIEGEGIFRKQDGMFVLSDTVSDVFSGERKMLVDDSWGGTCCSGRTVSDLQSDELQIGDILTMYKFMDEKNCYMTAIKVDADSYFLAYGVVGVAQSFYAEFIPFAVLQQRMDDGWEVFFTLRPSQLFS